MTKADEIFLTIFKDLRIEQDPNNPGTSERPYYHCHLGKENISNLKVIQMVKQYQEAIIESLMQ